MADLRSEIEARKSRIAELKKQREALAQGSLSNSRSSGSPAPQQLTFASFPCPQIEIEPPFLYFKKIQTDRVNVNLDNVAAEEGSSGREEEANTDQFVKGEAPLPESTGAGKTGTSFKVTTFPTTPAQSLAAFVDNSWRAIARSKSSASAVRDYTALSASLANNNASAAVHSILRKHLELKSASSLIAFSPHFDDLLATLSEDPRRVCIWSKEAADRPEFVLRSPTPITALAYSPNNASYMYAGGVNGQVLAWDIADRTLSGGGRFDILPQLRSPIENSKILALQCVGAYIISLSEEGILYVWSSDALSRPRHSIILEDKFRSILPSLKLTSSIVPTTMAIFISPDSGYGLGYGIGTCVIGSIQGQLFRIPAMPATQPRPFSWKHSAPVTCLSFRPNATPDSDDRKRQGSVLLSGGLDWRIRVWFVPHSEVEAPVELAALNINYAVADLCWHPTIPSVFAAVGEDQIQIWNLDQSLVKPIYNMTAKMHDEGAQDGASKPGKNMDRGDAANFIKVIFTRSEVGIADATGVVLYSLAENDPVLQGSDHWILENRNYTKI